MFTATDTEELVVLLLPSCPTGFTPQQKALPSPSSPHVKFAPPSTMPTASVRVVTLFAPDRPAEFCANTE